MGLTWTPPEVAAAQVREARRLSGGRPFVANFALAFPCEAFEAALDAGAPVVGFSWGQPGRRIDQARQCGAKVVVQAGSPEAAREAALEGADAVICQGIEAGGHVQSSTPLADLLPRALDAVAGICPVIAAGGIATGHHIRFWLDRGADGAMLGTRFVATRESRAHAHYKAALLSASSSDTVFTCCFDGGWPHAPHRVLRNETLVRWEEAGCPPLGRRPGEADVVARAASGEPIVRYEDTAPRQGMTGSVGEMALYAGTGAGEIRDLPSAGELIRRLWSEAALEAAP
jgi:nitronate monooxygenase